MRKLFKIAIALVVLCGVISAAGAFYLTHYALTPGHRGKDIEGSYRYMTETYPFLEAWLDSLSATNALKETDLISNDSVKLHAYYIEAAHPTSKTAVIVHGHTDNAIRMMHIGYLYSHVMGFNVLLPDLRFHGKSGGESIGMGWNDRHDVARWVNAADSIFYLTDKMVIHGISMGAATVMMLSGDTLNPHVKCLVEDCGYTTVWEQFSHVLKQDFKLPEAPLLPLAEKIARHRFGWGFREASAITQVEQCSLPMLFIHGDADKYVPTEMVYRLYAAKPEPKELWIVPGAAHATSYKDKREEYTAKVKSFVERYIN